MGGREAKRHKIVLLVAIETQKRSLRDLGQNSQNNAELLVWRLIFLI